MKSTITSKGQTTIPKPVRTKLGLVPKDVLQWEIIEGSLRVQIASRSFLRRKGMIQVGAGSAVDDVKKVRNNLGARRA